MLQLKQFTAIVCVLSLACTDLTAQILGDKSNSTNVGFNLGNRLRRADLHFQYFAYKSAANLYEQELNDDPDNAEIKLQVAECYRKMNQPDQSAFWYAQVIEQDKVIKPVHRLYYAQSLASIGKYDEAKVWYQKYSESVSGDSRASNELQALQNLNNFYLDSAMYDVAEIGVNSPVADFSPSYFQDGVVFVSDRGKSPLAHQTFSWNERAFLDLYYSQISEDGNLQFPTKFYKGVNTKFHEGPLVFFEQGNKMIFTRNNYISKKIGKSQEGIIKLKLYQGEQQGGGWANLNELPFNSDEYSAGHPAITEDGSTLYFASDMPGGLGGTDIYKTSFSEGKWSPPINMGKVINSEGNEMFPFISSDGKLFYASNGKGGLGGLDVFQAMSNDGEIVATKNLGYPVNTNGDDFGLILDGRRKSGYFSSNREGGTGDDDIYYLLINRVAVEAILVDKETGEPISDGSVTALEKNMQESIYMEKDGNKYLFDAIPGREYEFTGSKENYETNVVNLSTNNLNPDLDLLTVEIPLEKIPEYPAVDIPDSINSVEILLLENISGKKQKFYIAGGVFKLYPGTEEELQQALAKKGMSVGEVIRISNIYYDLDKSNIRPDASEQLDKLAALLTKYQRINLFMDSHTDSRSTDTYNDALSNRRSNSSLSYLVQKGINKDRLENKAFGERELVNDCGNDIECTEAKHQFNRRTEFEIVNY